MVEILAPDGFEPILHVPHQEDEGFYIFEGELTFYVGERTIKAHPGSYLFGPGDVPHAFTSDSGPARLLFVFSPAGLEGLVREMGEPARSLVAPPIRWHDLMHTYATLLPVRGTPYLRAEVLRARVRAVNPRPLHPLDAEYGSKHRSEDRRSLRLGRHPCLQKIGYSGPSHPLSASQGAARVRHARVASSPQPPPPDRRSRLSDRSHLSAWQ
jgi:hypothetical protein